ncbi:MAG: lipopolysaccharide transport periplasmic protein LptA [Desulfobulbaceae bacterium]|nr:lipopolysaccharide transport periplasmic protein LptA [Desulfobulbaceae bacterium]
MFKHLKKSGPAGLAALTLTLTLLCPTASPAGEAAKVDLSKEPVHIEADRMESDQKSESVLFVGNVEAHQADLAIKADRMTVFYQRAAAPKADNKGTAIEASRAIDRLTANGAVEIVKLQWNATGDQLEYLSRDRKIILTGNTKVWQDNNLVTGDRIVLYLDEGKSIVERKSSGEGERVKAFFYPDAKSEKTP